jgi:hypothetical protein
MTIRHIEVPEKNLRELNIQLSPSVKKMLEKKAEGKDKEDSEEAA